MAYDEGGVRYQLDDLDRNILSALLKNARTPYAEMAEKFSVSSGTVHTRVEKLRSIGVIKGSKLILDRKVLGYDVTCFIGVNLKAAKDCQSVLRHFTKFEEIVEAYTTTGSYSLFIKVITRSVDELNQFLIHKMQSIREIQSTETIITLSSPFERDITP
jgi:Lrp/AsnC family transcriptional regulator for asnA, asnC and gidA